MTMRKLGRSQDCSWHIVSVSSPHPGINNALGFLHKFTNPVEPAIWIIVGSEIMNLIMTPSNAINDQQKNGYVYVVSSLG